MVAIIRHGPDTKCTGGHQIKTFGLDTPRKWARAYGAKITNGRIILYKALDNNYKSSHGMEYRPGAEVIAPDWDRGKEECGGGLHFCAQPGSCLGFFYKAERFVACDIKLDDLVVHIDPQFPNKVKARKCRVLHECDIDGKKMEVVQC